jgi:hypothetical protein
MLPLSLHRAAWDALLLVRMPGDLSIRRAGAADPCAIHGHRLTGNGLARHVAAHFVSFHQLS